MPLIEQEYMGINHFLIGPTEEEVLHQLEGKPDELLDLSTRTNNLLFFGVKAAIEKGANIKKNGRKALMSVLNKYSSITITKLLNQKFNLHLPEFDSETLNTEDDGIKIINLLLDNDVDISLLYKKVFHEFVVRGEVEAVSEILNTNNLNKTVKRNALVSASKDGNLEIVQLLIERGVNTRSYLNKAFLAAAYHGQLAVVELLVANGADIHINNEQALAFAVSCHTNNGHLEVLNYLLENGTNIELSRNSHPSKWRIIRDMEINEFINNIF